MSGLPRRAWYSERFRIQVKGETIQIKRGSKLPNQDQFRHFGIKAVCSGSILYLPRIICGKPRFNRSLRSSIGLNGMSFVRASGERFKIYMAWFKTVVRDAWSPGGQSGRSSSRQLTRRHPVLHGVASLRRSAVICLATSALWYF